MKHWKSGMITNLEYYSRSSAHRFFIKSYLECIETNPGGVLQKKEFLKISQNLQENTCATVSFLIKLQVSAGLRSQIFHLAGNFNVQNVEIGLYETWPSPLKIIISICKKLSCLSACKKSTPSLTSFLRYCKEIENLLFRVIWACLASHT